MAKKHKKVKEEEVEVKTILIPDTITQVPPQEPVPRDMTFEKPPGTVLKETVLFLWISSLIKRTVCL